MEEAGLPGFDGGTTHGVYAPAATRPEIVTRLNTEINKALQLPAVVNQINAIGADPSPMTIQQFIAIMESDSRRYAKIIRERNIQGD